MNVPSVQTTLLKSQETTPSTMSMKSLVLHGSVLGESLAAAPHFSKDAESRLTAVLTSVPGS